MRHAGKVVTRLMLVERAWEYNFELRGNIIQMHLRRLPLKVDLGFAQQLIQLQTGLGAGYMIRKPVEGKAVSEH